MIQINTLVKAQKITSFKRSLAVVIGINEYQNKIPKLQTARRDAEVLAQILSEEHQYDEVILITDETECKPTLKNLLTLLEERLPQEIQPTKDDRLLFYFAGHGIARNSDKGPAGSLVPQDADLENNKTLLTMQKLHECLSALSCRHLLVILDCCFAGTFRWSTARLATVIPTVIRKEHYDRFIKSPAWQAITSAAHNQEALDILSDNRGGNKHSPFAQALFQALRGEGDVIPAAKNGKSAGDGVITATELYLYLRDNVETASNESQTPGIWTLSRHDRGEYIFLVPGAEPKLKPAPKLTEKNNPYRGLQSFEEEHSQLFFGRKELVDELYKKVSHASSSLTVVSGISGSGKSSLVKAGLIPYLRQNHSQKWYILKPMRPSESPFTALARILLFITNNNDIVVSQQLDNLHFIEKILQQEITALNQKIDDGDINSEEDEIIRLEQKVKEFERSVDIWKQGTKEAKQRLIVDSFDDINNLCRVPNEQRLLKEAVLDCLNPLSQRLQDPNEFIKIVKRWSEQRPGIRLLLVIDQFEELITLSSQSKEDKQNQQPNLTKSQQFLKLLEATLAANLPQLSIVVTLRSDFEPRFLNSEALKSHWTHARFPVRAMRSDELRQAIERPAAEMALYFEQLPGQQNPVDKLVDEVGQMPGALPLLSFTLSQLYIKLAKKWETGESSDRALILDAEFDFEGGVAGSLTRRANKEYDELPDDAHRDTMRRVMLRMVTIEGGELARRRVPLSELVYADKHDPSKPDDEENQRVELVLKRLIDARLVVSGQETGEPYVEPAHDFLVRSWDQLQKWQQQEQENLALQRRLTPAALEWKNKKQSASVLGKAEPVLSWFDKKIDSSEDWLSKIRKDTQERQRENKTQFLWNGNPYLDVLRKKLKSVDYWFNQVEAEFVQQSVWQRRRNTNLRWSIAISVMLGLSVLTLLALIGQRNALIGQIRSSQRASEANFVSNQQLDALINSLRAAKTLKEWPWYLSWLKAENQLPYLFKKDNDLQPQLVKTLRKTVYDIKEHNRIKLGGDKVKGLFFKENNSPLILINKIDTTMHLLDFLGKEENFIVQDKNNICKNTILDGDSKPLAFMGQINLGEDEERKFNSFNCDLSAARIEVNRIIISNKNGNIIKTLSHQHLIFFHNIFFNFDNQKIVTIDGEFSPGARLWNLSKNKRDLIAEADSTEIPGNVRSASFGFNSDRKLLATGTEEGVIRIFDLNSLEQKESYELVSESEIKGHQGSISNILFSSDSKQLITVSEEDGSIRLWNWQAKPLKKLRQLPGQIKSVSFSSSDQQFVIIGRDGFIRLGDLQGNPLREIRQIGNKTNSVSFSPDGKGLVTLGEDQTVRLWDLQGNFLKEFEQIPKLQKHQRSSSFSYGGDRLAIIEEKNTESSWVRLLNLDKYRWDDSLEIPLTIGDGNDRSDIFLNQDKLVIAKALVSDTAKSADLENIWIFNKNNQKLADLPVRISSIITIVRFSPDGSLLAVAEANGTLHLWDWKAQTLLSTFKAHQGHVNSISFSSDNSLLATAGEDGTATLWEIGRLDELIVQGCNWVRDYLATLDENNSDRYLCDNVLSTP